MTATTASNGHQPVVRRRERPSLLDAALCYAARGIPVFPVWGVTGDGQCRCGKRDCENAGKHPVGALVPHGLKDATSDAATIRRWWQRHPDANVAIITGAESGLVVLDADGGDGLVALKALGTPATTWLSKTGRGYQQFFSHPGGATRIGNRAGLRPDLDVRGDGGYVVVPPSRHASGRRYEWLTPPDRMELALVPADVLKLLSAPTANGDGLRYADPRAIPEGRRNDALYREGRSLAVKGWSREAIAVALLALNREQCTPPLPETEVRAIAEHVVTQPDRPGFALTIGRSENRGDADASTDASGLDLVTLGDLLSEPDEQHAWVVRDRLPAGGFGLLAGKPKAGKSTLARCLALRVARGEPWLSFTTTRGPVIYLALEEKRDEVRQHFRALGAMAEDAVHIMFGSAPADALARLRREAERLRPALVIIDPLFRFVHVRAEHGNDYAAMTAALEPLMTLARETGACVLAVHHLGKGERSDTDAILGSTAIFGAVDTALIMKRGDRYRTLSSTQRYGADLEEITVDLDSVTRDVVAGPPRAEAEAAEAERLIIEFLDRAGRPIEEKEFDGAIECRRQVWKVALRRLVDSNRIGRIGRGGKGDPFRYCGSLKYPGTWEPESGSHPQTPAAAGEDSGSRVPPRVLVPAVPGKPVARCRSRRSA
jgi:hypothetical protein